MAGRATELRHGRVDQALPSAVALLHAIRKLASTCCYGGFLHAAEEVVAKEKLTSWSNKRTSIQFHRQNATHRDHRRRLRWRRVRAEPREPPLPAGRRRGRAAREERCGRDARVRLPRDCDRQHVHSAHQARPARQLARGDGAQAERSVRPDRESGQDPDRGWRRRGLRGGGRHRVQIPKQERHDPRGAREAHRRQQPARQVPHEFGPRAREAQDQRDPGRAPRGTPAWECVREAHAAHEQGNSDRLGYPAALWRLRTGE
ncbi:hypothetical protein PybrP1_001838 [[Pythium] brassicae (nom. inval.)]|nr:hypothetical protein PybrP1_001838 [[Pythium] brassicae (nom. inval.)]